jgi:hypothetical protein
VLGLNFLVGALLARRPDLACWKSFCCTIPGRCQIFQIDRLAAGLMIPYQRGCLCAALNAAIWWSTGTTLILINGLINSARKGQ